MAVQARNTATDLSFSALQAVHRPGRSLLQNISASNYFRNGGIVSSMATNGQIAESGQSNWQLSQFVGSRGSAWQYRETITRAAGWGPNIIRRGYEYTNTDSTWVFDSIDRDNTSTNWFMKVSPDAATTCSTYSIGGGEVRIGGDQFLTDTTLRFLAQTGETTHPDYQASWGRPYTGAYFTNTSVVTLLGRTVIYRAGLPRNSAWTQDTILTFPTAGDNAIVRAYRWNNVNYFLIAGNGATAGGQTRIYWKPADNYAPGSWNSFDIFSEMPGGSFKFTVQAEWAVLHGSDGHVVASDRAQGGNEFWYNISAARTAMGTWFVNTVAFNSVTNIWIMAGQGGRMIRGVGANLVTATWTEVGASLRNNPQWQAATSINSGYIDTVIAWGQGFICHGTYPSASAWSPDGITWYFGTGAEGQTVRSTISSKNFEATFYDSVQDRLYFFYKGGYYIRTDGRDLAFTADSGTTLTRPYPANATGGTGTAPPAIGSAYQGGYYVGRIVVDGLIWRLIVSPKSDETSLTMRPSFTSMPGGTTSLIDGWANSQAMFTQANPATEHPAVNWCRTRTSGGYTDWYLPSRDEIELIYRNLKPTTDQNIVSPTPISPIGPAVDVLPYGQNLNSLPIGNQYTLTVPARTSVTIFQQNGGQELSTGNAYWTSSRTVSQPAYAWTYAFVFGNYSWGTWPDTVLNVRPVRRVLDA